MFETLGQTPADVVVLALNHQSGEPPDLALLRRLHLSHPKTAKILLIESCDRDLVVSAFRSGARGLFCFADSPFRALCKCIQVVYQGQIWATSQQVAYLIDLVTQVPSVFAPSAAACASSLSNARPRHAPATTMHAPGYPVTDHTTLSDHPSNPSRRWTVIASGLLLSALALVMLYTGRSAFRSPLAIVVIAAIGLAAALLQLRLRGATAESVRVPIWLNVLGLLCALAALLFDYLHFNPVATQIAALAAVGCFAVTSFLLFDHLRKKRT